MNASIFDQKWKLDRSLQFRSKGVVVGILKTSAGRNPLCGLPISGWILKSVAESPPWQ